MTCTFRNVVQEGSTHAVTASPKDASGSPATPITAEYRIDSRDQYDTEWTEVKDWTAIGTPSSAMTITMLPADLQMLSQYNELEVRRVTVRCTNAGGEDVVDYYEIELQNSLGVT